MIHVEDMDVVCRSCSCPCNQRSFFGGDESVNEFTAAFDVSLVTGLSTNSVIEWRPDSDSPSVDRSTRSGLALSVVGRASDHGVRIQFTLDQAGAAEVNIFNILGRRVRRFVHGWSAPGVYFQEWDGHSEHGQRVASGVYFAVLSTQGATMHRKFTLVR